MAITEFSPLDALKKAFRDDSNRFLSDAEYLQILDGHIAPEATYTATRMTGGVWSIQASPLSLHRASFSEEPGASYDLCSGGGLNGAVSIRLTSGSDLRASIAVTGCAVDLCEVIAEILVHIATHRAQEYAQSLGGGAVSPETARAELMQQASILRGVCAV